MVKEEIVSGLRQAISKGEPLEKAMMSFYNAGYKKEDIEEAAAAQSSSFIQPTPGKINPIIPTKPLIPVSTAPQIQRASSYDKPRKFGTVMTILLFILLLILLGLLAGVIIFKDELSALFNSLILGILF